MKPNRQALTAWCVLIATLSVYGVARGQDTGDQTPPPTSQPSPRQEIAAKRAALAKEITAAKRNLETVAAQEGATVPEHLGKEIELLEQLDLAYGQRDALLQRTEELRTSRAALDADLAALRATGPSEERPDSFLLLETVRSELNAHIARGEKLALAREAARKAFADARTQRDVRERERRQAKEALETNTDEARVAGLAVALRLAELESRLAAETLLLREMESRSQDVSEELYNLRLTLLTEKAAWIEQRARFAREDLDEQLDKVAREERTYKRRLDEAKLDLDAAVRRLADTRQRRDRSAEADQALVEEVEAARLAREARQLEVTLFGERLQRLVLVKQFWTRRFRTLNPPAPKEELKAWQAEANGAREKLDLAYRLQTDEISELRNSRVTLQEKLESAQEAGPGATRWIREQIRRAQEQIGYYESSIASVEAARRLCDKLLAEIGAETETVSFGERFAGWWEKVLTVWRYELTSVDDRPITVSKICIGLLLLIVGIFATRFITKVLGKRVLPRFGLNEGAAAAVQSLLFYLLVLTVALLALRIVNVPLTAFTIVGGGLAIGVGFGSQSIVNNFISGLILLVERPIRVSDLIEVDDLVGTVEYIGPRATRVRSPDNVDIIVPNSSFLERNVINWTLSDDRFRTQVAVGIAYGSPTRDAAKLIRKAVDEHGKVLRNPKPIVLFTEFGDNALNFEVHFWVRMRRVMDRKIVESDVRYRIDSLFREAGIVIAFPQRDVHLDAVKPLEVRVVSDPQPTASSAP